eukprot:1776909-Amphidinium_carterae.1
MEDLSDHASSQVEARGRAKVNMRGGCLGRQSLATFIEDSCHGVEVEEIESNRECKCYRCCLETTYGL